VLQSRKGPAFWLLTALFALFVLFLYGPTITIVILSFQGPTGGLVFPGNGEPGAWDFLYFAFVIGMTGQVSDVAVASTPLRRVVLAHAVVSFFYYAVILAVAVNAAVNAASSIGLGHR